MEEIKGWIKLDGWRNSEVYIIPDYELESYERWPPYYEDYSLNELLKEFEKKKVSLRYGIKNKKFNNITEEFLRKLYGELYFSEVHFFISEWTDGFYDESIIDGHNLSRELNSYKNQYIIIEIEEV